jgi:hypothetical protein
MQEAALLSPRLDLGSDQISERSSDEDVGGEKCFRAGIRSKEVLTARP